ncbi:hypothetical protein DFR86_00420 [Acidianus sulfidivorans JP7]|uniref:DNA methylase N-4/N-6 domain-containing protein n=1 Tax=Acidianus sulfidivorans JP7 TaxID=619593 RepID=A0A2U9IJC6_9CREN|nr:DNA methyltransferase [Acidianus sulfidivorans]AWR96158.1 hypothetical protein DFR86_00420 [Acidianus sulfidivorans JP7]
MSFQKSVIRYWGRKVGSFARDYILSFSKEGDVILDSFGGAGSIISEALSLGRRGIYNDLNPIALIIAKANILKKDVNVNLSKKYANLYKVKCKCGELRDVLYYIWEGDKITKAKVLCRKDRNPLLDYEGKDVEEIPPVILDYKLYYENGRPFLKRRQVDKISDLFTRRNLLILNEIWNDIPKEDKVIAAFISILYQSSKMSRLNAGSWGVPSYWIPYRHLERNPYILFERAMKRISKVGGDWKVGSVEDVLKGESDIAFLNENAEKLPLPDNSVDLIVTDPPFFDEIQYFELSYFYAAFLGINLDFKNEIVVNENRGKTEREYLETLDRTLEEMHRVLKRGRYLVFMFHEENEEKVKKVKDLFSTYFDIEKEEIKTMSQRNIGDRNNVKGKELRVVIGRKL